MSNWHQTPAPGSHRICLCGDSLTVTLFSNPPREGTAWLRTNLGHAQHRRREIIEHVEHHAPLLVRDWHDLPMTPGTSPGVFEIRIPLFETGRFEAKAFFMPAGEDKPLWPEGENLIIKVEPAETICANSVYTAFVRQFGPNMRNAVELPIPPETLATLDANGCTVIPKSGTFRALTAQLDHIIGTLGFRIIQLLPIHPVPTTFARMGRFGSPFASIDFFNVDPALAEFDRKSTPLDQFAELVDGIHQRNASLFIDLPINHTGWASHLQLHHPEWFARNGDQSFASPGAWGVTWEDLSELDYRHRGLWEYMADVFLFWCAHGVDGFRCDAGYMVPLPVWEYIVAKVRQAYPDTIFLLEGLGGKISVMRDLLDRANLNWAYSEIFQVYDRGHLEQELHQYHLISSTNGTLINFAETHDNNRLAAHSQAYARMRTALVALCSESGAFGVTNGVEWFAEAKVDVHGAPPLNWDNPVNQIDHISRINQLLKGHPAFCTGTRQRILPSSTGVLQLLREPSQGAPVLALVNLDLNQPGDAIWAESNFAPVDGTVFDLLGGGRLTVDSPSAGMLRLCVPPGAALCLGDPTALQMPLAMLPPAAVIRQRLSAMAMALHARLVSHILPPSYNPHGMAQALATDPIAFCESISGHCALKSVTTWQWPVDLYRCVMLPSAHALFIQSPYPFRAALDSPQIDGQPATASSLPLADGTGHFAFLLTENQCGSVATLPLKLTVYTPDGVKHANTGILQLPGGPERPVELRFGREALRDSRRCALLTNGAGAMSQVRLEWGRVVSQYDCMLAINTDPRVPVDRRILLTRCRAWLLHKGYSYEIRIDCTTHAAFIPGERAHWSFDIPAGLGQSVPISFDLRLCPNRNHIVFDITRHRATHGEHLADDIPVTLILRPDIEDRCFHESTKAYSGPEYQWPHAISTHERGFRFDPGGHAAMRMETETARFSRETEWLYGIPHPFEADRGLEPNGDLFSPGFFAFELNGAGQSQHRVDAFLEGEPATETLPPFREGEVPHHLPIDQVLVSATRDFIVRRDDSRTVIAGYPWFLDWGRDTLICLRGIIAAGMLEEARDILIQFARFEDRGTLPNMIRGNDDRNRDTSDAPLWFFTACNDLLLADPSNTTFLQTDCKGRPLRAVLRSLAEHMIAGTPNGIRMDPTSALIFSPSHFTWMDTNYPAGTPREGYPIEIQALWYAALQLLARIDDQRLWQPIARQVRQSIETLYRLPDRRYLADCLHAQPGTPAAHAVADNALRPNQLLAVTLGAVDTPELVRGILNATARLLIPGAIRSLADQPVSPPLPIHGSHGLLNDPGRPYWGEYRGDEDSRRKPAYHNGTAWTWLFPSYCEALAIHDAALIPTARSLLSSICELMHEGCVGHLPEILDGNLPHHQRGCWAQAWGATEALRVLKRLTK